MVAGILNHKKNEFDSSNNIFVLEEVFGVSYDQAQINATLHQWNTRKYRSEDGGGGEQYCNLVMARIVKGKLVMA